MLNGRLRTLQKLVVAVIAVAVVAGGATLAVAGGIGSSHDGNAGHDQYNPKPGCGPWKTDGFAGGSGYHDGQPPKEDDRGDCPKPPCDRYSHFSSFATGSSHHDDDCDDDCDRHRYSGNDYGSHDSHNDDCRRSSERGSTIVPALAA